MIHRRGKEAGAVVYLDDPFIPYATMFKLDGQDSDTVECIACSAQFPLSDLLGSELEENHCPKCRNYADSYWRRFRHRAVPKES
jgi:hypothetical protein